MVRVLRFRVWGLWFKFQIGNNHRRFLFDYRFLNSSTRPGSVKYNGWNSRLGDFVADLEDHVSPMILQVGVSKEFPNSTTTLIEPF